MMKKKLCFLAASAALAALIVFAADPQLGTRAVMPTPSGTGVPHVTSGVTDAATVGETGSGLFVRATSPSLVTPILGVASATSLAVSGNVAAGSLDVGASQQFGSSTWWGSVAGTGFTITNSANGNYRLTLPATGLSGQYAFNFSGTNVTLTAVVGGSGLTTADIDTLAELNAIVGDADLVPTTRTITAGAGLNGGGDLSANRTLTLDGTTFVGNFTLWDSTQATRTWTAGLSGATDPVWTFGNNSADLTTGVLKYGGNTVATVGGNIGAATATTASAADNSTLVATTAYVKTETSATQSGTHGSPSTTNPLTPTWNGPMHTVWYGVTGTINLPAASTYAGRAIMVYNTGAFTITIDPNGSEVVVRDGTVQTGGVSFTLSSGAGNYVCVFCDGARWVTLGFKGTLALGS